MKRKTTRQHRHRHHHRRGARPGRGPGRGGVRDQGADALHEQGPAPRAEQDAAETRKNHDWDPNAPLYGKNPAQAAPRRAGGADDAGHRRPAHRRRPARAGGGGAPAATPPRPATRPPAGRSQAGRPRPTRWANWPRPCPHRHRPTAGADPFMYFVQAGAFRTAEDAEAQRAKLSLMGVRGQGHRARAGRPPGVPRARGPVRQERRCRPAKERLDRRRPGNRAGARPALSRHLPDSAGGNFGRRALRHPKGVIELNEST